MCAGCDTCDPRVNSCSFLLGLSLTCIVRGENNEVDQTRPELEGVLNEGTVNHMRYKLPDDLECDHCILMMRYRE